MPAKPDTRPTLQDLKASLGRELGMRKAFYAKPSCKMSDAEKAHEIACTEEALRIINSLAGLRAKLTASSIINELATLVRVAGVPTDSIVQRHNINPAHHPPQIAAMIVDDILAAIK